MTYTATQVRAQAGAPGTGMRGAAVASAGIAVAGWVSFGRDLFGIGGGLTLLYAATLGLSFAALFVFTGLAVRRTALRGFQTRAMTHTMLIASGGCAFLLGLTLPDTTPTGLQTIISGPSEPALGIAIGIANPLGVIGIATAIIALVLAIRDSRGRVTLVETWNEEPAA